MVVAKRGRFGVDIYFAPDGETRKIKVDPDSVDLDSIGFGEPVEVDYDYVDDSTIKVIDFSYVDSNDQDNDYKNLQIWLRIWMSMKMETVWNQRLQVLCAKWDVSYDQTYYKSTTFN